MKAKRVILFIISYVLVYLAISFIHLEINFSLWSKSIRIVFICIGSIISLLATMLSSIADED